MLNFGIKQKLLFSFGAVIIVFAVTLAVVYTQFRFLLKNSEWTTHTHEVLLEAEKVLESLINMETGQRGYLLVGEDSFLEPLRSGEEAFEQHFNQVKTLTSDNAKQQQRLDKLYGIYTSWDQQIVQPSLQLRRDVTQGLKDTAELTQALKNSRGKQMMDSMREVLGAFSSEELALLDTRTKATHASERTTNLVIIVGSILCLAVGLSISIWLSRHLFQELGGEPAFAKDIAHAITKGDLCLDIPLRSNDKSSLLYALKTMVGNLNELVKGLQNNARDLQSRSESLALSASEIDKSSTQQSASTGNMAASVEELSVSITSVSESAQEALTNSNQLKNASVEGSSTIQDTLKEMSTIANMVDATSSAVTEMSESSKQISRVIEVIREVTEQTNLLALNAAIEAARAGEMGRGFSVVADEVRKLAEKTTESANEIAQMITKVHSSTDEAVVRMTKVVESVGNGQSLTQNAGSKISEIQHKVEAVTAAINHISIALQEQSQASYTISESVENIAQMTEENAAVTQTTSKTAEELSKLATKLNSITDQFRTS